jgi:hypothetical protein
MIREEPKFPELPDDMDSLVPANARGVVFPKQTINIHRVGPMIEATVLKVAIAPEQEIGDVDSDVSREHPRNLGLDRFRNLRQQGLDLWAKLWAARGF